METAIRIMADSISEHRADGKASPLVGAVLVKQDGSVESASRGELRDGDHAEFALLERKNRSSKLDGAVLFSTLEPCAPGSRRHPKLSCAERIVLARIKEVWASEDGRGCPGDALRGGSVVMIRFGAAFLGHESGRIPGCYGPI